MNNRNRQLAMQSGRWVIRQRTLGFSLRGTITWQVYSPVDGMAHGFYDFHRALKYAIRVSEAAKKRETK